MRIFFLFILAVSLISCATEIPISGPDDQATELNNQQADILYTDKDGGFAMGLNNPEMAEAFISAMKDGSSLIFGNGFIFGVKAPSGWVIDMSSGAKDGLPAVFYEEGNIWGKASNFMYIQIWDKENNDTLESVIKQDINQYRKDYPFLVVKDKPDIVTAKGASAMVKEFTGGSRSAYETIAYFDEPKAIVMLVFTSLDKNGFDSRYSTFNELVNSYNYVGEFQVPPESN